MRGIVAAAILPWASAVLAQGLVENMPDAAISSDAARAVLQQQAITRAVDIRAVGGRSARQTVRFGEGSVVLQNVRIDPNVRSSGSRVASPCNVRLLVNDTPLNMSASRLEGTRGQARPIRPLEVDEAPPGLAATLRLYPYPFLLQPVSAPTALGPKDTLTIELSSPSKDLDCAAKVTVSTTPATGSGGKRRP